MPSRSFGPAARPRVRTRSSPLRIRLPRTNLGKDAKSKAKEPERVVKSLEEWQKILTPDQFMVTRMKGTEPAFSGKYASGHFKGTFLCIGCGAKLFDARHKFESGTGWPSFYRPINEKALETAWDYSEAEARVEVTCRRCGAHLGHVFQDGPAPTGLRFCMNSVALKLDPEKANPTPTRKTSRAQAAKASKKSRTTSDDTTTHGPSRNAEAAEPKS